MTIPAIVWGWECREGIADYAYGDAFPHEVLFDQFSGVDFSKGCYVGQEVVSRMHHRGTARKRIIMIKSDRQLPEPGTKIMAGTKPVGETGSSSGTIGLAMLRLDRVKDAIDAGVGMHADDIEVNASIQPWANFDWPGG